MRFLAALLIVLATTAWHVPEAEARSQTQQAQTRAQASQPVRAAAQRRAVAPQRQAATIQRRATATQATAARATVRQAAARSTAGRGVTAAQASRQAAARSANRQQRCRAQSCAAEPRAVSWQAGLEPPTNAQAGTCPAGTLATLARGHSDIVRCLPL
jgi:hypothetical protein